MSIARIRDSLLISNLAMADAALLGNNRYVLKWRIRGMAVIKNHFSLYLMGLHD